MDISKIEVLLRAIELGSMSKAAEEYSYTPSALTHIVNSIENEIGIKIIKRTYAGIEVEESQKEIVNKLKQIVELKNQLIKMSDFNTATITICTYASLSKYILPKIIKGFKKKYPEVDINIIVEDKLENAYNSGNSDILFGENINHKDLVWDEIMTDPYVAVVPKSYNLTQKSINREELCKGTFIMANDHKISKYIGDEKIKDIIKINSHDDSSVIQLVKEEMGVSVLPALSVKRNKSIKYAKLAPEFKRVLGLLYKREDFKEKKYLKNFIEYFKSFKF